MLSSEIWSASPIWTKDRVDLTEYAGNSDLRIRFRIVADGSGVFDGWYIDDVSVAETTNLPIAYPFFDNLEGSDSNWVTGSWARTAPGYGSNMALTDSPVPGSNYLEGGKTHHRIILGSTIDLSAAINPRLSFWHKRFLVPFGGCSWDYERDSARVYVSTFFGQSQTWQEVGRFEGADSDWTRVEIDFSFYAGFTNVRIMFAVVDDFYCGGESASERNEADGWYIDNIGIDELDVTPPAAIDGLLVVGNTANSVDLRWTAVGNDGNAGTAQSYDVRYLIDEALTEANWGHSDSSSRGTGARRGGDHRGLHRDRTRPQC